MIRTSSRCAVASALIFLALAASAAAAQTGTIIGTVIDVATRAPIEGATISVQGTALTALSRENGVYTILSVPPGTYTVRMTVGSNAPQSQTVKVMKDPRTADSDADIVEQFSFLIRIRDTVSAANNAVRTIRNVRYQMNEVRPKLSGPQAAAFEAASKALNDSLTKVEEDLYQTKNESGQDPLNFPIRLNNQIGALAGFVSSGERRPPQQAYDVWNTLVPQLNTQLLRLKRQLTTQLPQVNATLKAAGQPEIVPGTEELGAPAGGRGGRGRGGV